MVEQGMKSYMGRDAINAWLQYWQVSGALRIHIVKRKFDGGDPAGMIPPDVTISSVPSVPAVIVREEISVFHDIPGSIPLSILIIELIDSVEEGDFLVIEGGLYRAIESTRNDTGDFSLWEVRAIKQ